MKTINSVGKKREMEKEEEMDKEIFSKRKTKRDGELERKG